MCLRDQWPKSSQWLWSLLLSLSLCFCCNMVKLMKAVPVVIHLMQSKAKVVKVTGRCWKHVAMDQNWGLKDCVPVDPPWRCNKPLPSVTLHQHRFCWFVLATHNQMRAQENSSSCSILEIYHRNSKWPQNGEALPSFKKPFDTIHSQEEKAKAVWHDLPKTVLMQTRPCATLDPKEIVDAISAKQRLEDLMLLNDVECMLKVCSQQPCI